MRSLLIVSALATALVAGTIVAGTGVDYPTDYRSWQHLKSMIIRPGHPLEDPFGGIHHVYANSKAMHGLSNGEYETGAVFVFDLLDYQEADKMIIEMGRKRIDVMQYDGDLFADTGGWGFDTFVGDSTTIRLDQDVVTTCYACHASTPASNYVFSNYRP